MNKKKPSKKMSIKPSGQTKVTDEKLINKYHIPHNDNLDDYAMNPINPNSLIIRNGVMYILGGVSSGKSTLMSKLMAVYTNSIHPIILSFYAGLTPDETTTFALNSFGIRPMFIRLETPEAMVSFFNQYRYKRIKLAELLMFLNSIYKDRVSTLLSTLEVVNELGLQEESLSALDIKTNKRLRALVAYVDKQVISGDINIDPNAGFIYLSEFLTKRFSKTHHINFEVDPVMFVAVSLISFSKGFNQTTITVDILNEPETKPVRGSVITNRFTPYTFAPFVRVANTSDKQTGRKKLKLEIVPSVSIFDDVASFPLLTSEHSNQWTKDLFAETRRWLNTFIIAAQRHNLLNKTLRSLTHTFFIGYSLVDDDIPRIAKEIPSNLLPGKEFQLLYMNVIKPFTFFVYNNKLGYNVLSLKR